MRTDRKGWELEEAAEAALRVAIAFFAFLAAVALVTWAVLRAPIPTAGEASSDPMDGSTAGANAVTIEELEAEAGES